MSQVPHVLHQKIRLGEVYRTNLVPSLDDVPVWRYRAKCPKMPTNFQEIIKKSKMPKFWNFENVTIGISVLELVGFDSKYTFIST